MTSVRTLLTVEEALQLPDRDDCRYELDEGDLIEMTLPRMPHQIVVARINYAMEHWVRNSKAGMVLPSDTPFLLRRKPDVLRGPDVAYVTSDRFQSCVNREGMFVGAPDLAVEVASPSDRITALLKKVFQYLEGGSAEVWLVMPASKEVHVYTQTESPRILRVGEVLNSPLLPGFSQSIQEIFE